MWSVQRARTRRRPSRRRRSHATCSTYCAYYTYSTCCAHCTYSAHCAHCAYYTYHGDARAGAALRRCARHLRLRELRAQQVSRPIPFLLLIYSLTGSLRAEQSRAAPHQPCQREAPGDLQPSRHPRRERQVRATPPQHATPPPHVHAHSLARGALRTHPQHVHSLSPLPPSPLLTSLTHLHTRHVPHAPLGMRRRAYPPSLWTLPGSTTRPAADY